MRLSSLNPAPTQPSDSSRTQTAHKQHLPVHCPGPGTAAWRLCSPHAGRLIRVANIPQPVPDRALQRSQQGQSDLPSSQQNQNPESVQASSCVTRRCAAPPPHLMMCGASSFCIPKPWKESTPNSALSSSLHRMYLHVPHCRRLRSGWWGVARGARGGQGGQGHASPACCPNTPPTSQRARPIFWSATCCAGTCAPGTACGVCVQCRYGSKCHK